MNETNIDLVDLLRRILLRWKAIILWMVIFAVLLDGFYYVRAVRANAQPAQAEDADEAEEEEILLSLAEMEEALTSREITEAKTAVEAYGVLFEQYQEAIAYNESSVKMQLDAHRVPTATLQFAVESVEPMQVYALNAAAEETCDEVAVLFCGDEDPALIRDLITVSVAMETNEEFEVETGSTTVTSSNRMGRVMFTVMAADEETALSMVDALENAWEQRIDELQTSYDELNLTLLQKRCRTQANDELLSFQNTQYTNMNTLRTAMNNLTTGMTQEQLDYYHALLDNVYQDMPEADAEVGASAEEDETDIAMEETGRPRLISKRYVVLGLLVGLLFAIVVIAIAYVFGRKLRVKEDVTEVYGIPLLGFLDGPSIKLLSGPVCRGINRAFTHGETKFTAEERTQMIVAGIRLAAEKGKMKKLYLTGAANDETGASVRDQLAEQLAAAGIHVSTGKSMVYDPMSLEQMTETDGVVFVERVDGSAYEDMAKEKELCERYEVPVIGGVVIR